MAYEIHHLNVSLDAIGQYRYSIHTMALYWQSASNELLAMLNATFVFV